MKKIPTIVEPSAERKMIEFHRIAPGNHLHFFMLAQATQKVGKKHERPWRASAIKVPEDSTRWKEEKSFLSAHTWSMPSQRNFFGFHSSCFFLFFVFILVFPVDVNFFPKELKGRKNVYSIMRLPAEGRKLSEKAKQKAKPARKKSWNERAIRRRTKRNYPVNKLLLWRDASRARREIVMAVQGLPAHQWQLGS